MSEFLRSYIETALWSSTDDSDEHLDANYTSEDLSPDALARMSKDCEQFQADYTKAVNALDHTSDDFSEPRVAHDFWLTRNRHGAGFWDGDYPKAIGAALTELAHTYGECDLYVGDDGKLYIA
jgi:hypothetical protein